MTAQLRYLAYLTEQPDALAAFYAQHLRFAEITRSPSGDISLTDGFIKLSLFRRREDLGEAHMVVGPHHVGFTVDGIEKIKARYRRLCPRGVIVPESGKHRGEVRIYDPECHPISLSESAFGLAQEAGGEPALRYLNFGALDPEALADFYTDVFGLHTMDEVPPGIEGGRTGRLVTDGNVILSFYDYFAQGADRHSRYGLSRCGFSLSSAVGRVDLSDPNGLPIMLAARQAGVETWHA